MAQNQIQDGSGSNVLASVNASNQLLARAAIVPLIHEASLLGNAYSWTAVTADIDAGDTALLVANRNESKWLVISSCYVRVDVESQVKIHVPGVATWAGTAVVGVNLNRAIPYTAQAVAYADESGATFAAANVIETVYCPNAVNAQVTTSIGQYVDFKDSVILGYDDAIAADVITEPAAFECTFVGYFIDKP